MGDIKVGQNMKKDCKCACNKKKQENGGSQPPFLDDLVQWNQDLDDDENPSFFWSVD